MATMNPRFLLAGVAAICLAAWLFAGRQDVDAATAAPVAAAAVPQAPSFGQGGWFSATPQGNAPPPRDPGSAVFGRNGRAVDLGGLNVAQYIASRIGAARSGDPKAAYEVYQAESICAANDDPVADYHDPAQKAQFLREREGLVKLCAGMSPAQVQERLGFLGTAARAGQVAAQVDFYMEGPYGREFDMAQNADDPTVRQWKEDALGYLKQAGGKCDHFALALLSTVYDAGQLTERDLRTSIAYRVAAAVPRKKPVNEEQLRNEFGDQLSPADFASALQLGAQMAQQACPG